MSAVREALGVAGRMENLLEQVESEVSDRTDWGSAAADYGRLPSEREVLRALWGARRELVRSEIHRRMPYAHRPTLGRVGQILSALHKEKLLVRQQRKAQGSRKAGFYTLSDDGHELCVQLGFQRDERRLLFSVPDEVLRATLTRRRLSWRPGAAGRIITAYGYRAGLGLTTMVAHVARGLAEHLPRDQRVLVMDLDLGAPGLDEFFARQGLGECRGLTGLLVDYERRPPRRRALWLRGALRDPEYVLQPAESVPNLYYLSSGLGSSADALKPSERAEALTILREEAATLADTDFEEPGLQSSGFLGHLRESLLANFARTVIDSQFGNSLGAFIAVQSLADELALCMDDNDTSEATLAGLRHVLGSFLSRYDPDIGRGGGVFFLFRLSEAKKSSEPDSWIDRHLLMDLSALADPTEYRTEQLPYNSRMVADRYREQNKHFFKHLIPLLTGSHAGSSRASSPEMQSLLTVLNPGAGEWQRSMAAGLLENASLQELARSIDWQDRQGDLPILTDLEGEKMLRGILETQVRRLLSRTLAVESPPDKPDESGR